MHPPRYLQELRFALIAIVFSLLFLASCEGRPTLPAPQPPAANQEKVFLIFEGPWAFVDDPHDSNMVLALAPRTKIHRDLYLSASNETTLASEIYSVSVPPHGAAAASPLDVSFAQAKISAQNVQHAIDDKSGRYVIRLPKPEAYVAANRYRSRVGPNYPPDASTEQKYVTIVSLQYTVSSLNGFALAGNPDSGTFAAKPIEIETPAIRFAIEPAQPDGQTDVCQLHSRRSFAETVKFLGLMLFVDFPADPASCQARFRTSESLRDSLSIPRYPLASLYFFHATGGACHAPILFLTVSG